MKPSPPIFLLFLCCLAAAQRATAQTPNCQNIALWDLSCAAKDEQITNQIANEIESILSEIPGCTQLEQRRLATFEKIKASEKNRNGVNELSSKTRTDLKAIKVERIVFGSVVREEQVVSAIAVNLHLDELETQRKGLNLTIRLTGAQTNTENLRNSIRPYIYDLVGIPRPRDPRQDALDKAKGIDTRAGYEAYLRECGAHPCPEEASILRIIEDEKAWEEVMAIRGAKAEIAGLTTYVQKGNTRHWNDTKGAYGAQTRLRNHLATQDAIARREWSIGYVFAGAGLAAGAFGLWLDKDSKSDYDFYKQNPDAGDLSIYDTRSRDDYYRDANRKHVTGQWLQAGGITLFTCGACFLVKRFTWTKTLKNGRKMLYKPTLSSPLQPGFRSNGIGVGLQVRF